MKYYLDTCIWRDLHENRVDRFRPLGEWALRLINNIIENKDKVLYSELTVIELKIKFNESEIEEILRIAKDEGRLEKVNISSIQQKEARVIGRKIRLPWEDALHAILARDNQAMMITRDKHFAEFQGMIEIKKPEELL